MLFFFSFLNDAIYLCTIIRMKYEKQLTALLPMSSVPIKNNGAEGLLSISIEEMKELREFDVCSVWPWSFIVDLKAGNFKEYTSKDSVGRDFTWQSHTFHPLFPSMCHWLLQLYFAGKAEHGLWLFIPSTGALADPVAVILDCMSTVPEKPSPAVIQGHHRFCYF